MKHKWNGVGATEPVCFSVSLALTDREPTLQKQAGAPVILTQCLSPENQTNSEEHLFCHLPELSVFAADHCCGWYYFIPYLPRKQGV